MARLNEVSPSRRMKEIAGLLWEHAVSPREMAAVSAAELLALPREKLQRAAKTLGLPDEDSTKTMLAQRLQQVLTGLVAQVEAEGGDAAEAAHSKFDLGAGSDSEQRPAHIPWSYGQDRITSMLVSPETMFTYWEVTDETIERTRPLLGDAGRDATLHLRIYDITGRIFDGTNALGHFDIGVSRTDRQWFIHVGKPGSSACVELGLRAATGTFVRIARSGRVDFPKHGASSPGPVQWLTVRADDSGAPSIEGAAGGASRETREEVATYGGTETQRREWTEYTGGEWSAAGGILWWKGPIVRTSWESGPFAVPVVAPTAVLESYEGPVTVVTHDGHTRVVYGPWKVVIRGLGGWAERRVLSTWQMCASWIVGEGFTKELRTRALAPSLGGSEAIAAAASEWRFLFGSELRLGGASEVFFLGASEMRLLGASERLFAAASEQRLRGASEARIAGASERRLRGASEQRLAGASEALQRGASEARVGGGSEHRIRLGGASESLRRHD